MIKLDMTKVIKLYQEGISMKDLANQFGVASGTIRNNLIKNNIPLRTRSEIKQLKDKQCPTSGNGRRYTLNFNYFKQWNHNMAYILGFIGADGYIDKKETFLRIVLQRQDKQILEDIKRELQFTGTVRLGQAKNQTGIFDTSLLLVTSKYMVKDLINLGIVNKKSFILSMDKIPEEFKLDFIRGYFDGDGSVGEQWSKKSQTPMLRTRFFSGSKILMEEIQQYLTNLGVKTVNIRKDTRKELYILEYSQKASLQIYDLFYQNKELICLSRKKEKFESVINRQQHI